MNTTEASPVTSTTTRNNKKKDTGDRLGARCRDGHEGTSALHPPPRIFLYQCCTKPGKLPINWNTSDMTLRHNIRQSAQSTDYENTKVEPTVNPPQTTIFYGNCFNCGEQSHSQHYCPLIQCSKCQDFGHMRKVCGRTMTK